MDLLFPFVRDENYILGIESNKNKKRIEKDYDPKESAL